MNDSLDGDKTVTTRTAEILVALLIFSLGAIEMWDSWRLGAGWAADGPESGYFPFRIGAILCIAALVILVRALRDTKIADQNFVPRHQFRRVISVLVPSLVYVGLIATIGIYVASILYVGAFMRVLGRYGWGMVIVVPVAVMSVLFMMFEVWFLVPLPKGPIEELFGY
jgi:hypothetical protein